MPTLKKLFFSSKSSRNSPKKQESSSSRRLTRQRKIRHVSDGRLGLSLRERWPDDLPPPQPLPLPEFRKCFREKGSDRLFRQSSNEGTSKGGEDGSDERVDIKPSSLGFDRSSLPLQFVDKTPNHPTPKSEKPPTYFRRGFPLTPNDETHTRDFKLNIPARSAPTSALSSPLRSPQRFNTVNFLFSETPKNNFINGGTVSPSLQFLNSHINANLHNLHPLPLPPSSPRRTQSPTSTSTCEKGEATSAKGQWVKGKFIGRGTYGSVFEAINSETGSMCAMKEVDIIPDDPKSVECIKQLEQEIKILQHLEHKNIVRYYGCEVVGDHFCIYLEYVHPGSITKYVRDHFGAITESVVRNFTRHILSGLAYLHSTNTVHRDIKGANLLVDASGVVKLADFGLAKHLTVAATDLSLKGSPHWMAPELLQAVMRKDSDHQHAYAIDIWSLGCTVIEMFNGKPPWSECTGVQALFHVMHKSPVSPESLSAEGKDFLNWCFKRNPVERPTASQLLKHPFARTTKERAFSSCILDFSGMKLAVARVGQFPCFAPRLALGALHGFSLKAPKHFLVDEDSPNSPRQQPNVHRSLPTSPRTQRPLPNNGRSFRRESSREALYQSPCSILETLPSISSPDFSSNSPVINSYTHSPNNLRFASLYNYQNIDRKAHKGFSHSYD